MALRLRREQMWPLDRPPVTKVPGLAYFKHLEGSAGDDVRRDEVRIREGGGRSPEYRSVDGGQPVGNETSANMKLMWELDNGLNTSRFRVVRMSPYRNVATRVIVDLHCDHALTPWCAL